MQTHKNAIEAKTLLQRLQGDKYKHRKCLLSIILQM
jgi:hypothetical protein